MAKQAVLALLLQPFELCEAAQSCLSQQTSICLWAAYCVSIAMDCALSESSVLQATFEDELIEDAKAKRHSLTCEAVEIGSKVRKYCHVMIVISKSLPYF